MSSDSEARALDIEGFCRAYSIGRSLAYREIKEGRLRVVKCGRRTLVPVANADAWLQRLTSMGEQAA